MTRTWKNRLTLFGKALGILLALYLCFCTIVAGTSITWSWISPPAGPDVRGISQTTSNETAVATAHAVECFALYKIATTAERDLLKDCFPLPADYALPETPKIFITTPLPLTTLEDKTQSTATAQLFTVFLTALERPYAGAAAKQAYYAVPVSVINHGPTSVGLPERVGGPPAGVKLATRYSYGVTTPNLKTGKGGAPLATDLAGFFTVFLTTSDAGQLAHYVTGTAQIGPLGAYQTAFLTKLDAAQPVPDNPVEGTSLQVLAQVKVLTELALDWPLTYPLTVTFTKGAWAVSRMDYMPLVDLSEDAITSATSQTATR